MSACASFAKSRRLSLPADLGDLAKWKILFDQADSSYRQPLSSPSWPRRVGIVPRQASCYQPPAIIESLTDKTNGSPVQTGPATRLLSGLGGVGKTQLAVYIAEETWRANQVDLLVWMAATSRQAIVAGYAQAASDLALRGANGTDTEQDAARFHVWLASTTRPWLIVLDDLTSTADLQGLWPPASASGCTVVTSQLRSSTLQGTGGDLIQVDVFSPSEAGDYLRTRLAEDPNLADDVDGVGADLGHLPLALAQAAAFMLDERLPCTTYRQRFADRRSRLDHIVPDPKSPTGLPDDYARTVTVTLSLSIERADRARPVGLAQPLLELASVLDPTGIPESLFATIAAQQWLSYRRSLAAVDIDSDVDEPMIRSGLQLLHRLNLVTTGAGMIAVHALVQRVSRESLTEDQLGDVVWAVADALVEVWPADERDTASVQRLRSNSAAVYQHGYEALLDPEAHPILFAAANSLGTSGDPASAVIAFQQLLNDRRRLLGPDHPDTLATRLNIAHWQRDAGHAAHAAEAFRSLLSDCLQAFGPYHGMTLAARHNLTRSLDEAGDPAGALEAHRALLVDEYRILGPDHPNTLATRSHIAGCRGETGDLDGAVCAYRELLADDLRVRGPDDPETMMTRAGLAHWRGTAGDPASAAEALQGLLTDRLRVLGATHPETLKTRHALGRWRGEAGDATGAAEAMEVLLADQQKFLGPGHPQTMTTQADLAHWRGMAGDPPGALAALEALFIERVRILGDNHPDTLVLRHNIAGWRGKAGDPAAAMNALEELLVDQTRLLGADHPHTLAVRNSLAGWRGEAGDAVSAVQTFEALLADQVKILDPHHPDTLTTLDNLIEWRSKAGDMYGAAEAANALVAKKTQILGPNHDETLTAQEEAAYWCGAAGDLASAIDLTEAVLAQRMRSNGPNDPRALATRHHLACWHGLAGDPARAATALEQLLSDCMDALGTDHPLTQTISQNLHYWRRCAEDSPQAELPPP
ncbi:tetratricopeptide repeat protein [Dactylosporangium matsuzakiense]|uniref:Tetratricopeptide repeat protein n=1 Tax=Dactylosporangium matsuzakiense TaxID=53360 RepID=A0A9W6NPI9_9ACTN|nr:tetratricopeptide repeat protein [Dactylosporangium matsuzakiense]